MVMLQVGKPFIAGRTRWPVGVEYNYWAAGRELRMFSEAPRPEVVEAVRKGECEFALAVDGPVIFFLYRFGSAIRWSDAPYSWHLVPEPQRSLPGKTRGRRVAGLAARPSGGRRDRDCAGAATREPIASLYAGAESSDPRASRGALARS
jgi:hypothetical protein